MIKTTEAAREREAFRYGHSLLARSVVHDAATPPDPSIVKAASDSALVAFAQLGALRLNATRALISLFDRQYQHVVAEATRSSSISHKREADDGDKSSLWLSGTAIPRACGLCERVLDGGVSTEDSHILLDRAPAAELNVCTVADLTTDSRIGEKSYLGPQNPDLQFYAGVPIRSRRGIDIGTYCVFGSEPHHSLDPASVFFLQDMSQTIMAYLETLAASHGHQRNVRMVRGLGSLVEGKASMSKWWLGDNKGSFADSAGGEGILNANQQTIQRQDEESQLRPALNPSHQPTQSILAATSNDAPSLNTSTKDAGSTGARSATGSNSERDTKPGSASNDSGSGTTSEMRTNSGAGSNSAGDTSSVTAATTGSAAASTTGTTGSGTQIPEDESIIAVKALLSRGANIVRESVECEGVLFLDAAIGSYGGLVGQPDSDSTSSGESHKGSPASSSEEASQKSSTDNRAATLCNVLGYSTSDTSSINGDPASLAHISVPEPFLKRLLRRYPEGRIFNFDQQGHVQSDDSSEEDVAVMFADRASPEGSGGLAPRTSRKRPLKQSDGDALISTFVGARSIALVPLWDPQKERWFAGGFVWTRTPTRLFTTQGELSYLKAFGMTVMAEVAGIYALRASKAKADVLGSVSHELRSPLHGIVLGIELLNDTQLDAFQEDVLHTLETCGRTLVDTINHLLDFSKINRYVRVSRRRAGQRSRGIRQDGAAVIETGMMNLYSDVGLDSLVEEVVESVYAGFSYQQISGSAERNFSAQPTEFARASTLRRFGSIGPMDNPLPMRSPSGVAVYLNIDPSVRWMFYAQPGAIRRVVMNLFGNALKYTTRGFITVSLTQGAGPESKRNGRRVVTLSISDSGKGIGEEYLRSQLFSPFTQEDHLASGVGLGLSLVKQIVTTLGGRISVESQVRRGTTVRVVLPLRKSRLGVLENATPAEVEFAEQVDTLKGRTVRVMGFSGDNAADNALVSATSQAGPKVAMEKICQDWLQMRVLSESDPASPSVYICPEDALERVPPPSPSSQAAAPVVVICHNASIAHERATSGAKSTSPRKYEYISQPAGARKLAKILTSTLKKASEAPAKVDATDDHEPGPSSKTAVPSDPDLPGDPTNTVLVSGNTAVPPSDAKPLTPPSADSSGSLQDKGGAFLLVDDNLINLKVMSSYMRKLGRAYDTAENGLEALDAYRQNPDKYACILMDISMPVMDGLESTRLIREFEQQNKLTPKLVIALTGLASSSAQEEAFANGVNIFLTKPVSFKELGNIVETKGL